MSVFPTQTQAGFAPLGVVIGLTIASGTASVAQSNSGRSAGATAATASGSLSGDVAGISAGSTVASGTLRLGNEPNVFGSGMSAGITSAAAGSLLQMEAAGKSFGSTSIEAQSSLVRGEEFCFTIFLTVINSAVQAAASGRSRRYSARLMIDDEDIPFSTFMLSSPRDVLGSQLSVTLARPLLNQLSSNSSYKFEVGIWASGAWVWQTLLENGKLAGRDYTISFQPGKPVGRPSDSLTFSAINPLADRWQLGPRDRRPVTLYDPEKADLDTQIDEAHAIHKEDGTAVLPVFEQSAGLSLYQVLNRAYVAGCGFEAVRTNIPNYPVTRADFSLEGGWHAGVSPLVAPFDPIYFVEGETLWLVERGAPLPAGFSAQTLTVDDYVDVSDSLPAQATTNALILVYQEDGGDYYTYRFDQEPIEQGRFGDEGYTRTEVTRKVREYRNTASPAAIVREVVEETKTEIVDHLLETIHRETQSDQFDFLGRKLSHTRTVESLVPNLTDSGALALQTVMQEQCSCSYRPHPTRPGESIQDATVTYERGLVVKDSDNTYLDAPFRLPIRDAHRSGQIQTGGGQTAEFKPIKTTIESLRTRGDGQVEVYTVVLDHLANTSEHSSAQPRVGAVAFSARGGLTKQVLLTIAGTELDGRRVSVFSAGEMPGSLALPLGHRKLNRLNTPPSTLRFAPVGLDFSLHRGSVRKILDRAGSALGTFMLESLQLSGSHQGENDFQIRMTAEGGEVAVL
jgi:hypothetical protein